MKSKFFYIVALIFISILGTVEGRSENKLYDRNCVSAQSQWNQTNRTYIKKYLARDQKNTEVQKQTSRHGQDLDEDDNIEDEDDNDAFEE